MSTTANLWELLCKDLQTEKTDKAATEHRMIAKRFLETAKEVFAKNGPRLSAAMEIAGDVCQASGEFGDASLYFSEALGKDLTGGNRTSAARVCAKLALLLDQMGEVQRARRLYEQALDLYDGLHDHEQHPMLLHQLAALCWTSGDRTDAIKYYQKAIDTTTQLHGENHPEVAVAINNLGVAYIQMENYAMAEYLNMQALSIRERCFGAHHPDVAQSMANLAVVYHSQGNYQKADNFYRAALKIYERFPQKAGSEVETVKSNYEALIRRREREQGA